MPTLTLQVALHSLEGRQPAGAAASEDTPALHLVLCPVLCAAVCRQDPQLLQLCSGVAGVAAYAGKPPLPPCLHCSQSCCGTDHMAVLQVRKSVC